MTPIVLLAACFGAIIVAGTTAAWVHDVLAARFGAGVPARADVAAARTPVHVSRAWSAGVTTLAHEPRIIRPYRRRAARPTPRRAVRATVPGGPSAGHVRF